MLLLFIWLCSCIAQAADDRPIIIFREDDIRATWRTPFVGLGGLSALEYGKQKRIPITWGIVTAIAESGWGLTYQELGDYLDTAGGEAASHSCRHAAEASDQAYINELVNSKALIEANLPGYSCHTFLQPGSWTNNANIDRFSKLNNAIGQTIATHYAQSLAYLGGSWRIGTNYYPHCLTNTFNIDYHEGATPDIVNAVLDMVAATPGAIFIMSCHGVQETGDTQTYHVQANTLKAAMDKLAELRDSGKVRLMSLNDAYDAQLSADLNRVTDADFEHWRVINGKQIGPWKLAGEAQISPNGGINNSKYLLSPSPDSGAYAEIHLPPGRYEMRWSQKMEPDCPVSNYPRVWLLMYEPRGAPVYAIKPTPRYNSERTAWEQHRALVLAESALTVYQLSVPPSIQNCRLQAQSLNHDRADA